MSSHVEATLASKAELIHEVYAKDRTGKMAYYFIMVDKPKQKAFMRALENPPLNLAEFGLIIASGYGEVTSDVKDHLLTRYCYVVRD